MGLYHGRYGFSTFTHQRAVVYSSLPTSLAAQIAPPYGRLQRRLINRVLKAVKG